ncbi:MAG: hypothetical protein WA867_13320, partial [Candidatus Acidiferrales bacterium]
MIRTRVRKLLAPGKKLLPAAFMALALCPLTAELAFARPQSNTDSVGAAVQPRAVLPLQIGFARGGTALYITPEVGVDPSAGADIVATAQEVAKGFGANFIPTNFSTLPNSPA